MARTFSLFYGNTSSIFPAANQTPPNPISRTGSETTSNRSELTMDVDTYTQHLSNQMAITLLPAILIIAITMIVATIGNIMVFYIYVTKFPVSSTRTAVLALASFDLVASCFAMPGEIVDLRYSYSFPNDGLCKTFRLGATVVLVASGLTLLMVAVDRYRRICKPMGDQLTPAQIKKGALLCLFVGFIFSIPSAIVYGLSKVPTAVEGVYGTECSIDQKYHNHILPLINNILQALIFGTVFTAIIVLYSLLGRVVLRQGKFRKSVRKRSKEGTGEHSVREGSQVCKQTDGSLSPEPYVNPEVSGSPYWLERKRSKEETGEHSVREGSQGCQQADGSVSPEPYVNPEGSCYKDLDNGKERSKSVSSRTRRMSIFQGNRKSSKEDAKVRKTTLMLFIITIVFVISFLPYLILKALQAVKKDFPTNSSKTDIVLYNVFVRSYFFNSVANCFIYGFCSPMFRKESKRVIMKLLCCGENK